MKVAVITPTFFPIMGGIEKGIYDIFRIVAQNHEIKIITPFPEEKFLSGFQREDKFELKDNLGIYYFRDLFNLWKIPGAWYLRAVLPPISFSTAAAASKSFKGFRPDIVICFYPLRTGLAALFLKAVMKIPVVIGISGREVPGPGIPPLWKHYQRLMARAIKQVIFISEFCRQSLGFDDNFGEIIPFGVDTEKFKPGLDASSVKKKLNIPQDKTILLAVQRLDEWKRVDIIIEAMKSILAKIDAYLLIVGKGPKMKELIELAKKLGVGSRIIFTGFVADDELPLYYAAADVFVFHSIYETLGISLIEAMAAGKPIVSVRSTAIPETVEDGQNGILVEPMNAARLAEAVISLLQSREKRQQFSSASRERALKKYSLQHVASRYENFLIRVLKAAK